MRTAKQIAEYILTMSDPEEGDIISHMKLQKLLYYCQGVFLAIYDRPLFRDAIEHWHHGPVIPSVYQKYKEHGSNALPVPSRVNFDVFAEDEESVIKEIYNVYGQFSAWRLREMTHQEPPWYDTEPRETISHARLSEYFKTQLLD